MTSTNQGPEYFAAESKYQNAESTEDKVFWLQEMISHLKKHKSSEKMLAELRTRLKKLRERVEKGKKFGKGRSGFSKEGDALVCIIGFPNTRKSTLLSILSGSFVKVAEFAFTTTDLESRTVDFDGAKVQTVEVPAFYEGYSLNERNNRFLGLVRICNLVVCLYNERVELATIVKELSNANIKLDFSKKGEGLKVILINSREVLKERRDELKERIWEGLGLIRVYTKTGKAVAKKPIVLRIGANVEDAVERVHKDFVKNFKYCKVWGKSAMFGGQAVGLSHKLLDKDVFEVFTK